MRYKRNEFDPDAVVSSHRLEDVIEIFHKGRLVDFLPRIYLGTQMRDMETWQNHFTHLDIPWAVTRRNCKHDNHKHQFTLWTEKIATEEKR